MGFDIVYEKIMDYLLLKGYPIKKHGSVTMVKCPKCGKEPYSAQKIPNVSKVNCFKCGKFTVVDFVRVIEPEYKDKSEEDIIKYLRDLFQIKVITEEEQIEITQAFDLYEKNKFSLVPITPNGKAPVEKDWINKTHYDKREWQDWLSNHLNVGLNCGEVSGVTVVDIDEKLPDEIMKLFNPTMNQNTTRGQHFIYKYESDLPTTNKVGKYQIDIANNRHQIVIFPSKVNNVQRKLNVEPINKMSVELKQFLLSNIKIEPKKEAQKEELNKDIQDAIARGKMKLKDLSGVCNNTFIKLGGILRKRLSAKDTSFVLELMNYGLLDDPMDTKAINAMCSQIEKYSNQDDNTLKNAIVDYLHDAEFGRAAEIEIGVFTERPKGENKKKFAKALVDLIKERKIIRKGNEYHIRKQTEWYTEFVSASRPLDIKVPYFDPVAYFHYGEMLLLGGIKGSGKCMRKGTKILMYDGSLKNVEDIQKGDLVMGVDSKPRTIIEPSTGYGQMYEIKPNNGKPFYVNDEHILSLHKTGTNNIVNIPVKEYVNKTNCWKTMHMLYRVPVEFKERQLKIDPYFMGLWLGDGDSDRAFITNKDIDIINWLKAYSNKLNIPIKKMLYNGETCPRWLITYGRGKKSQEYSFMSLLRKYDVLNNKHIPEDFKINSRENRLKLLAGILDADGSYDGYDFEITLKIEQLINDVSFLAKSLGLRVGIHKKWVKLKGWKTARMYYRAHISGNIDIIPTQVIRKQAHKNNPNKNHLHTGFKVKKLGKEQYYGFELNGDRLYLTDDFIVNHNSHMVMNIVKGISEQGKLVHLVELEPAKKFIKIGMTLGLKEGDYVYSSINPCDVEIPRNSIVVLDWILPRNYAETDKMFYDFNQKLLESNSFIIAFMQIRKDGTWFAPDLVEFFPSVTARFLLDDYRTQRDTSKLIIDKANDPKYPRIWEIPLMFNKDTCELTSLLEVQK